MFKKLILATLAAFMVLGCDTTDEKNDPETFSFATGDVKTGPAVYFSFADNAGDTVGAGDWDIKFATFSFSPAPGLTISSPYFEGAADLGVARVDAASLDDVTEVPGSFSTGVFTTIAEADVWFMTTDAHVVQPLDYVYVVNTADGKYPAFEITNYYDDMGESGSYTIAWKYLSE